MKKDALYYPQIGFQDPAIIKAMSLFYDNIYRIVPEGIKPNDDTELAPLIEDGNIGQPINPLPYSSEASAEFLDKIDEWGAAALSSTEEEQDQISRIHTDKIDEKVRRIFHEVGLSEDNDWVSVPTVLASNYMLYLARSIASKNALSLITKDWGAWTATNYFNLDGGVDEFIILPNGEDQEGMPFALFNVIVSDMVPVNINEIPSEKILEFRNKRKDEIANFRNCVVDLHGELQVRHAPEVKRQIILDKISDLEKAQKEYKKSADIIKAEGWRGFSMLGFVEAASFAGLFALSPPMAAYTVGAGIAFGGAYHLTKSQTELEKLRRESPASILVDIESSFKKYTHARGGGDANFHAYNCMEEYVND